VPEAVRTGGAHADRNQAALRSAGPYRHGEHVAREHLRRPPQRCRLRDPEFRHPHRHHPWLILSSSIGLLEIFGTRSRPGHVVEQAPFLVTLLVKGLVYGSLIAFVNVFEAGTWLLGVPRGTGRLRLVSVIFSFVVTAAFIFMLQISQIIG